MTTNDDVPLAQPVFGERALLLPQASTIVVGDLHIGLETHLRQAGVNIPSQTQRMRERLAKLLHDTLARRIIVIGDLKHRIPRSTQQEAIELPWFFHGLGTDSVELVRGNHDVDLQGLIDIKVHDAGGIRVGDVALLHGHEWPTEEIIQDARVVVTCHNHPAVMLVDALGHRHKEACWVRARFTQAAQERYDRLRPDTEFIVMPAFNELTGGTAINAPEGGRLLGPLFGNGLIDIENARLWTVDGVDLGTVKSLRKYGGEEKAPRKPRMFGRKKRPGDG
ncbi:MAG: metallophosphoesterase [Candidatus Thermoplasmatota archaeon]